MRETSQCCRAIQEAALPSAVVLHGQLEVCECYSDEGRHIEQDGGYTNGML